MMMGESIRVSGRTPDVAEFLREAMLSQRFADVALCCPGGQRFLAHRLVLSAASPYLEQVLLAHSKSAGVCEPITVILAEVEGPELAAILGLIYTGNAAIARPRLDAFLRAAQTLRVKLPPLPEMISCTDDYKPEDIKDVKPNTTYLQCDKYPRYSYGSLLREEEAEEEAEKEKEEKDGNVDSYNRYNVQRNREQIVIDSSKNVKVYYRDEKTEDERNNLREKITRSYDDGESKRNGDKFDASISDQRLYGLCPQRDSVTDDNQRGKGRSEMGAISPRMMDLKKKRVVEGAAGDGGTNVDGCPNPMAIDLCKIPKIISDNCRVGGRVGDGGDNLNGRFGVAVEDRIVIDNPIDNGSLNYSTEQRLFAGMEIPPPFRTMNSCDLGRPSSPPPQPHPHPHPHPHQTDKERFSLSTVTDARIEGEKNFELHSNGLENLFDLRVPALHHRSAAHIESIPTEKFGYLQPEQNSSNCRDSCCRWRPPRKHVANHVTASPWRQLTRPHHSPKVQPMLFQNHQQNSESNGRLQRLLSADVNRIESVVPTGCQPLVNDQFSRQLVGNHPEAFQSYELVPNAPNILYQNDIDMIRLKERKLQEFYRAQMLFPPPPPQPPPIRPAPVSFGVNQNFYQNQNSPPTLPPTILSLHSNTIPGHPVGPPITPQTVKSHPTIEVVKSSLPPSGKPELSHPVSRLCDSMNTTDTPLVNHSNNLTVNVNVDDETRIICTIGDNKTNNQITQSDSNNNNPSVNDGAQNRPTTGTTAPLTVDDHRCEQCGKTFVTRASLKVHARTHSGEKPFQCSDCGKQFSQLRNYKYHRSVHEGTREFAATCPECGKYFNDRGYLSSHMKIHRNRKEYACGECGKSFNQRVAYNMHVRIHTGVKPHQCEQCGKAFSRKMLLKQHLRTHSGERPYQCQVCHKAFADRSNMTLHTRLHSGLKPYQCTLCSKAFTKKHHLKTHLNYHTGTKPYSCPNCGLRFSQSSNMRTHFKKCSVNNQNSNRIGPLSIDNDPGQSSRDIDSLTTNLNVVGVGPRTPSAAMTPPNSDQESSVNLTPLSSRSIPSEITKT